MLNPGTVFCPVCRAGVKMHVNSEWQAVTPSADVDRLLVRSASQHRAECEATYSVQCRRRTA